MSGAPAGFDSVFMDFVAEVQNQAVVSGDTGEERLTNPCRDLLRSVMGILGTASLTIIDKAAVGGRRPDLSLYDAAGRLILCVELKAPGKGSDPNSFTSAHDKKQWLRYQELPNLIYTDGNSWSLWHSGKKSRHRIDACDDVLDLRAGVKVNAQEAADFFTEAFGWKPSPIKDARELALESARYCRLLRDQLEGLDGSLVQKISRDWRDLLFPDLEEAQFLDAYAQTVTFALLTAGSLDVEMSLPLDPQKYDSLNLHLHHIASELEKRRGLLGKSLSLLTQSEEIRDPLATYLQVLLTVMSSVDWPQIRGTPSGSNTGWLHFYEDFLQHYDKDLRKQSGSYYTPSEVVEWMTLFTHKLLELSLDRDGGYADATVTVVDPCVGTGTFLLGVLDRIEESVTCTHGPGQVRHALAGAAERLIGFEVQSGPYSVTQLRLVEHLNAKGAKASDDLRVYLTNTLDNPHLEQPQPPLFFEPISESRNAANEVKRNEPVVVVIGNPPYLEGAGTKGGWVEEKLLDDWKPPADWGVAAHTKNLSNLYVYFWRWAAWKVYEDARREIPDARAGIVSFITTTGFLTGDGFQRMRQWLREQCSEIWVMHLSPEGHQAPAEAQVFGAMRQPVAIVTAVRASDTQSQAPATVRYHIVPSGTREDKFAHIAQMSDPTDQRWVDVNAPKGSTHPLREPFTPAPVGRWDDMTPVADLFPWSASGVMAGRTWPIAPHPTILKKRWRTLLQLPTDNDKRSHFVEHPRDRTIEKPIKDNLTATIVERDPIKDETDTHIVLERYGYRSFDRQWIIRDKRVINQPNPSMWSAHSDQQIYMKVPALSTEGTRQLIAQSNGTIISFSEAIPDMHYLSGSRAGRVHPLWRDPQATEANVSPGLLDCLAAHLGTAVTAQDMFAYLAAVVAHPGYTDTYRPELLMATEVRVPLTADAELFRRCADAGREVLRLHTFGQRVAPAPAPPRVSTNPPLVSTALPETPREMSHDPNTDTLIVDGTTNGQSCRGAISNVTAAMHCYTTGTMNVLQSWFGYRKPNPSGTRRSPLDGITLDKWDHNSNYADDLLDLLHVLRLLTDLHPLQRQLLDEIAASRLISSDALTRCGVFPIPDSASTPPPPYSKLSQGNRLPV